MPWSRPRQAGGHQLSSGAHDHPVRAVAQADGCIPPSSTLTSFPQTWTRTPPQAGSYSVSSTRACSPAAAAILRPAVSIRRHGDHHQSRTTPSPPPDAACATQCRYGYQLAYNREGRGWGNIAAQGLCLRQSRRARPSAQRHLGRDGRLRPGNLVSSCTADHDAQTTRTIDRPDSGFIISAATANGGTATVW